MPTQMPLVTPTVAEMAVEAAEEELAELDLDLGSSDSRLSEPPVFRDGDPLEEFTDNARKRYEMEASAFAADLLRQSLAHKRYTGGAAVSGRDVSAAARFLRSYRSSGVLGYAGVVGGVLVGLGVQSLSSMVENSIYTAGGVMWGVSTTVAGVALVVWNFARQRG